MLSFSDKELRQQAVVSSTPKIETHECHLTSNFFGIIPDGTEETCECGQKWRMKSGRFFYKWEHI